MLEAGKPDAARKLIDKNLEAVDTALKSFPEDADFHALLGYTLKDVYQSSKDLLSPKQREAYLKRARKSFEQALRLDPQNASAHNGLGNVLFFEGQFDAAIKEIDTALELTGGNYSQAEHDRRLAEAALRFASSSLQALNENGRSREIELPNPGTGVVPVIPGVRSPQPRPLSLVSRERRGALSQRIVP